MTRTPSALTIAGSDSGGGAGIQADLKAFAAHGVHGLSAIAALTAQNTRGVTAVHVPPPGFLRAQIDACFDDFDIGAVKLGMLATADVIHAVADALGVPAEELYRRSAADDAGRADAEPETPASPDAGSVEAAIRNEARLSAAQKEALLAVFRGFLEAGPGS